MVRPLEPLSSGGRMTVESGRGRVHVDSPFMRESLMSRELIARTEVAAEVPILEDAHMVHLGGRLVDRGAEVILPLIEAIVEARRDHQIVVGVGGGVRERHTYAQATDLGLPVGALAQLVGVMCKQNATMIYHLLAQHGGVRAPREEFPKIPFHLAAGGIPVIVDLASYHYWEHLPHVGRIPLHRPDTSALLFAEVFSCRSCTFLKDVEGLFEEDPRENPEAALIGRASVAEIRDKGLDDSCLEPTVLDVLERARNCKRVRIVNGARPELLAQVLRGEPVGSLVTQ